MEGESLWDTTLTSSTPTPTPRSSPGRSGGLGEPFKGSPSMCKLRVRRKQAELLCANKCQEPRSLPVSQTHAGNAFRAVWRNTFQWAGGRGKESGQEQREGPGMPGWSLQRGVAVGSSAFPRGSSAVPAPRALADVATDPSGLQQQRRCHWATQLALPSLSARSLGSGNWNLRHSLFLSILT